MRSADAKSKLSPSLRTSVARTTATCETRPVVIDCLPSHVTDGRVVSSRVSETDSGIRKVMVVRVFVAGGTGVVGRRLVPQLVAQGHQVTATTTSAARLGSLEQLGAEAVVMAGL